MRWINMLDLGRRSKGQPPEFMNRSINMADVVDSPNGRIGFREATFRAWMTLYPPGGCQDCQKPAQPIQRPVAAPWWAPGEVAAGLIKVVTLGRVKMCAKCKTRRTRWNKMGWLGILGNLGKMGKTGAPK